MGLAYVNIFHLVVLIVRDGERQAIVCRQRLVPNSIVIDDMNQVQFWSCKWNPGSERRRCVFWQWNTCCDTLSGAHSSASRRAKIMHMQPRETTLHHHGVLDASVFTCRRSQKFYRVSHASSNFPTRVRPNTAASCL